MMKKLLLLFSTVVFISAMQAQSDNAVMLTLNGADNALMTSGTDASFIATLPSGENIVADVIKLENSDEAINIKKIGSTGSVTTLINLLLPTGSVAHSNLKGLTVSASGNYTCLFGEQDSLYLVKFSNAGAILFQKGINVPDITSLYYNHSLDETPTGQYYITLSTFGFAGVVKLDSYGDLEWSKRLAGPRDDGKCPSFCTEVTSSGGCITTLKDNSYETLIQLAPDGSLIWSRSFGDLQYRWTKCIKQDNLGNFFVMGTFGSGGATFYQKLDSNGNLLWAKTISSTTTYQDAYVTNSNELIIASISPSLKFSKIGPTGNIVSTRGIGGIPGGPSYSTSTIFSESPSSEMSFLTWLNDTTSVAFKVPEDLSDICNSYNDVVENTIDDNQILGAEIDSICHIDPLIANITNITLTTSTTEYYLSQNFCEFISASINENEISELNIYPNPASNQVNIDLNKVDAKNAMLAVYDMTGRKVFEKQLMVSTMETISVENYAAGLYTIIVSNSKEVIAKQRVVVQK